MFVFAQATDASGMIAPGVAENINIGTLVFVSHAT